MLPVSRIDDSYDDGDVQLEGSGDVFAEFLGVARINDKTTGHPCPAGGIWPGVPIITGSGSVFANFQSIARVSDLHDIHCCGPVCHTGALITGAGTVFAGG